jgi:outer membrane protein OmpA-like peptidoglycan-associated protein
MSQQIQWLFEVPSIPESALFGLDSMADVPGGKGSKGQGIDRVALGKRVMNLRSQILAARKQAGARQKSCRDQIGRFDVSWRRVVTSLQRSDIPAFTLTRQFTDLESRVTDLLTCLEFSTFSSEINPETESQWLFEVPFTSEATSYTNLYSNPEWEAGWELQEANPYGLSEEEWETSSVSSSSREQTIHETVSGFSRYSNAIPPQERAKILRLAQLIVQSHRSGQPIRTIRLVGHADRDIQRGANFEKKISGDRALSVQAALSSMIERLSQSISAAYYPMPPISTRINWQQISAGATQRLIQTPKSELERTRNRRIEILMSPMRQLSPSLLTRRTNFSLSTQTSLSSNIETQIEEFCSRIGSKEIDRSNCFKAVGEVIQILSAKVPKNHTCVLGYSGSQLIEAKQYHTPLSRNVTCCPWQTNYYKLCETAKYKNTCGHCSGSDGKYLVLKYKPLAQVIKTLKCSLDRGCVVRAGVLSGICDDKPDMGCAKRLDNKSTIWRDCPEHWILILGYDGDQFLFWDSSRASAIARCGHEFGLLHYNSSENRLTTAPPTVKVDLMAVNPSGFHVFDERQKRYQVIALQTGGPYKESMGRC